MGKIKSLNRYQKGILLFMAVMVLVFSVIYPVIVAREGFLYRDEILIPSQEHGNTVYSGKIQGKQARFTVSADKTVEFRYGDKTYGSYTATEDAGAIPEDEELSGLMTGIELRQGEQILFRGGVLKLGEDRLLYNKDGSLEYPGFSVTADNGVIAKDKHGNIIDPMEPSAYTILDLMAGPELTHKGDWLAWFGGVFVCMVTAISILFADELFRWNLSFQIRNADRAEPSDLELAGRYFSWVVLPVIAMILFITGLQ